MLLLEEMLQDLRFAIRVLTKTPAFSVTALAALGLGLGSNIAIFSVVNAVLLRPLSFPDAARIVLFRLVTPSGPSYGASATKFNIWREQSQLFDDVSAYEFRGAGLNLDGTYPEQIHGIRVSAGYFHLLAAPIVQGRTFTAGEDRAHGGRAVVLSYGLWQRRFGGDPRITGKAISLSGVPYPVVGVLGPGFNTELDTPPDVFLPFQIDPNSTDHAQYFNVIARLKPGISAATANAGLQLAADEFRRRFPKFLGPLDSFNVEPFGDSLVGDVRPSLLILSGAVGLVLLIACANVANLLLVRASFRKRELAIRSAIGAGRGRIVRQLLTESMLLSVLGGALGLALGSIGVRLLLTLNPGDIPRLGEHAAAVTLDYQVVLFTAAISLFTGLLFGSIPAFSASNSDLSAALKEGAGRSGSSRRQNRTRSLLVVSEIALALVLLIGAALLIRSFFALSTVAPGFNAHNILTARMSLSGSRFAKTAGVARLVRDAVLHLEALPGVVRAAASYSLPLQGGFGIPFNLVDRAPATGRYDGRGWIGISPGYFAVFGIPILRGRAFHDRDVAGAPLVAMVNRTLAQQFWPDGDPLGQRLLLGQGYGPEFEEAPREIIGVSGDVHDSGLNLNPGPIVYVPLAQVADGITAIANRASSIAWTVRTRVPPQAFIADLASALQQASGLPVAQVRSMDEVVSQSTARSGFNMWLLSLFGASALVLAVIGIYGVMAFSVQERLPELGIRLALGAQSQQLRNLIVRQGMRLAFTGVVIGLAAALMLTRLIAGVLFGVQAWDPLVFTAAPLLLIAAAFFAVWLPGRRAAAAEPLQALRRF